MKKNILFIITVLVAAGAVMANPASETLNFTAQEKYVSSVVTTDETARCLNCHASRQIRLVETWEKSRHAKHGVGCYECHQANPEDPAAKNGHFSFSVQLPVSPLKCAECHPAQYASFASSSHAMAYETIRNVPLKTQSPVLFEQSCAVCHGNDLKMARGRPVGNSWPNHGIGRINTDGSRGNCAACHGFHDDSLARARSPETCAKCHHGDTGPAYESWKASRHGNNWHMTEAAVDMNKKAFNPANEKHLSHPDCFTCHLAPNAQTATSTHNPGERLSWKLAAMNSTHTEDWGKKRLAMQASCMQCHASTQVEYFYRRFDAGVLEFNRLASEASACIHASDTIMLDKIKGHAMKGRIGNAMQSPLHIRDGAKPLLEIIEQKK